MMTDIRKKIPSTIFTGIMNDIRKEIPSSIFTGIMTNIRKEIPSITPMGMMTNIRNLRLDTMIGKYRTDGIRSNKTLGDRFNHV